MIPDFVREIGSDRLLDAAEITPTEEQKPVLREAWDVYQTHFQSFTGSSLDSQFEALRHPASQCGSIHLDAGVSVLVVGAGPSLASNIDALTQLRTHFRIFTSPRGAEVLLDRGIVPDLVIVEHQTALDAHHSARHVGDRASALLEGVAARSMFVPSRAGVWGLWPATAAAMAIDAGASCVALLGVDLGTCEQMDRAHAPLAALLGFLAGISPIPMLDCGVTGARKHGWFKAPLAMAAGAAVYGVCETSVTRAPDRDERIARARDAFLALRPLVERALHLSGVAIEARAGRLRTVAALEAGLAEVMAWRHDRRTRILLQESLGVGFLPRLWRIGVDPTLGAALWRPLMLATHEIVGQAEALTSLFTVERAA
jgi:hypothetical protein